MATGRQGVKIARGQTLTAKDVPKRFMGRIRRDIEAYGKAYLVRGPFGWYAVSPESVVECHPAYTEEGLAAARQSGSLLGAH